MIKILRDKSIGAVLLLFITAAAVHYHLWINPIAFATTDIGFLQQLINNYQHRLIPQVWILFYFILIISQALQLNAILVNGKMFTKNAFTTAFAYLLLTAIVKEFSTISAALFVNTLLLIILKQIISLYNNQQPKAILFNIGLLVAIGLVLYPPSIVLILLMIFGYVIMRSFKLTEFFILIIGLASVFYIVISIMFLIGEFTLAKQFIPNFSIQFPIPGKLDSQFWLNIGSMFFLFLVGFFSWLPNSNRMVIQSRKNWGVTFVLFLTLCFLTFIFNGKSPYSSYLIIIPIASFASNFFLYAKKLFLVYLVLIFAITVIVINNQCWLSLP